MAAKKYFFVFALIKPTCLVSKDKTKETLLCNEASRSDKHTHREYNLLPAMYEYGLFSTTLYECQVEQIRRGSNIASIF